MNCTGNCNQGRTCQCMQVIKAADDMYYDRMLARLTILITVLATLVVAVYGCA